MLSQVPWVGDNCPTQINAATMSLGLLYTGLHFIFCGCIKHQSHFLHSPWKGVFYAVPDGDIQNCPGKKIGHLATLFKKEGKLLEEDDIFVLLQPAGFILPLFAAWLLVISQHKEGFVFVFFQS